MHWIDIVSRNAHPRNTVEMSVTVIRIGMTSEMAVGKQMGN